MLVPLVKCFSTFGRKPQDVPRSYAALLVFSVTIGSDVSYLEHAFVRDTPFFRVLVMN